MKLRILAVILLLLVVLTVRLLRLLVLPAETVVGHGTGGQQGQPRQRGGVLRDRVVWAEPRVVLEAVVVAVPLVGQPSRSRGERPWNRGGRGRVEGARLGFRCTGTTAVGWGWTVLVGAILGRGEVVIGGGGMGFVLEHVCHCHVVDGRWAGHVGRVGAGWGIVVRRLG